MKEWSEQYVPLVVLGWTGKSGSEHLGPTKFKTLQKYASQL